MLNKIINFSLHNRLLVMMAGVILLVAGVFTSRQMEVDVFPDLNAPTVVVMTEANGMAAEEVERTVTFPIETAVNGATDVRRVRSSSTSGFSVVWVEFDWGTDIYRARQIVSEKLATLGDALPRNVGTPTLGPQSSILGELMIVGLTSDTTSQQELRTLADWVIRPRLLSVGGVSQVTVIGGEIKEYQILLDPERMRYYQVSMSEVLSAVENLSSNANGSILNEYGNEYILRGILAEADPQQMGEAVIRQHQGVPVTLSDVATLKIGDKSPRLGVASERGKPAVLLTVTKQPKANSMELTEQLDRTLAELQASLPANVHLSNDIFRQARFIEGSIDNIRGALFEGAIFVVIVLLVFLMNFRTTLISLVALPLSLLVAVLVLKLLGLTINTMSLGGMAIAIGSLVDDAIIDVENVFRRLRENFARPREEREPVLRVVYDASTEIRTSVVNATVITIVAFVPLFFLDGMEGRMLRPLGISFIVALFASMIVAVTLTP
ncbi:MAG: efflux RND transporter permease subunit, partial [Alistipes sp.]|nr:efflux RND transporter permease subunit [Alistipes sp.]